MFQRMVTVRVSVRMCMLAHLWHLTPVIKCVYGIMRPFGLCLGHSSRAQADRFLCLMQPAIFALILVAFKVTDSEVAPPVHPRTNSDHVVLPIEDSCFQKTGSFKQIGGLIKSDSLKQTIDVTTEGQAPKADIMLVASPDS